MNKKQVILLTLIFFLTGCYNYRELNDLAIASGISISKEKNEYKVTVEVVNPKKEQDTSSSIEPDFVIYTASATSIQEALRDIIKESPRKIYGAQIDILIIDENVAKTDLKNIMDFFARDPELRSEYYVLIGKNNNVLNITTSLENISAKNILDSLKSNNKYLGTANLVTYHDMTSEYLNPYIEIALPSIEVIGNNNQGDNIQNIENAKSETSSVLSNIAVFKNNKLIGYLTKEESQAFNFIMGNTKNSLVKINYPNDEFITTEVFDTKAEIKPNLKRNKITITLKGKASLSEVNHKINLDKEQNIENIQKDLNQTMENKIKTSVNNTIQKFNSDIYGFQDIIYKNNPKEHKQIKDNWYKEIFPNLKIEVKSKIAIIEKGNLNGGTYHE